jgi:hypothetical protein
MPLYDRNLAQDRAAAAAKAGAGAGAAQLARRLRHAADVARGVAGLHAAGLVHLDLKPENVLLHARSGSNKYVGQFTVEYDWPNKNNGNKL